MPRIIVASCVLLLCACGVPEEEAASSPQVAAKSSALTTPNGSNLNGSNLNGSNLNGSNLNGQELGSILAYVQFQGAVVNGWAVLDEARLNGTQFWGRKGSSYWTGTDFLLADFTGVTADGTTVPIRIDAVTPGPSGSSNADVWRYRFSYQDANGAWWPVCKDEVGPIDGVPVTGRWSYQQGVPGGGAKTDDPSVFTIGCVAHSAIAKCVMMGYKPWLAVNGVSLNTYHQACVRLIRADYCGDGTSHTVDGQWVNLYDGAGVQTDTENWVPEAEWDALGARCFYPLNRSHEAVPCYDQRQDLLCGSKYHFNTGTLIINETPDDGILDPLL